MTVIDSVSMRANAVFPADLQSYGPNGSEFHKN